MRINTCLIGAAAALGVVLLSGFPAQAKAPPPVGSRQWNILAPYASFVVYMTTPDGYTCCDLGDGRGDFKETVQVRHDKNGKAYNHYIVRLVPGDFQYEGNPVDIDIPDDLVLSGKHAREVCADIVKTNPNSTCRRPPFNVIWAQPSSEVGKDNTGKGWFVHCYIPRSEMLFDMPKNRHVNVTLVPGDDSHWHYL